MSESFRTAGRTVSAIIGLSIVLLYVTITVVSPWIVPYDPNAFDGVQTLQAPSPAHAFGTDGLGRDVFTRTMLGGRVAIPVTIVATALALGWGGTLGVWVALVGGRIDDVIMRLIDAMLSIPRLLLLLMIVSAVGTATWTLLLTLAFFYGIPVIRVVRAATLECVALDYISAARVRGEHRAALVIHELLPNVAHVLIVEGAVRWSSMLLSFSALSFLGFGVAPPTPDSELR